MCVILSVHTFVKKVPIAAAEVQPKTKAGKRKQELAAIAAAAAAAALAAIEKLKEAEIELPLIDFKTENEKRLAFKLVFQTLKCQYNHIR